MAGKTYTWIGGSSFAAIATNWSPTGQPKPVGDTAIVPSGTVVSQFDLQLNNNTIEAGGTGGVTAGGIFSGDTLTNFGTPTLDSATVFDLLVPGQTTAESALLDAEGIFVNEGSILADGPAGSSLTIDISGTTIGSTFEPGYFYNSNLIQADAGNTVIINVGSASEQFNTGDIVADGGTVIVTVDPSAIAGGVAPVRGFNLIEGGGTLETAAFSPASDGNNGTHPEYEFADSTPGNTLKIDNIGSFDGVIAHFSAGDTIDLGHAPGGRHSRVRAPRPVC